jgi:GH25 family lysozyme M1 (1,4-beta-N-acetylmuramidase)
MSARHAVLLIHADPSVLPRYQAALEGVVTGARIGILVSHHAGLSSAYEALYAEHRAVAGARPTLAVALAAAGLGEPDQYDTITIAPYSAGYAYARRLLGEQSRDLVAALVCIDSWHSGIEHGHAAASGIALLLDRAVEAAQPGSRTVCWYGHSDVPTQQTGPGAYASTTQVAAALREACALGTGPDVSAGGLRVRAYDVRADAAAEHRAALTEWGPAWVAGAVAELLRRRVPCPDLLATMARIVEVSAGVVRGDGFDEAMAGIADAVHSDAPPDTVPAPPPSSAAPASGPTDADRWPGIDVSHHQMPMSIDWGRLRDELGIRWMIARATYGTRADSACAEHVRRARDAGLLVGAYHFLRQQQGAEAQLDALWAAIATSGLGPGDIVPALDCESNTPYDGPVHPVAHNMVGRAMAEAIRERCGACLVYISLGHWQTIGQPAWVLDHAIWTAHWNVPGPAWPDDWAIWQHSATMRAAGATAAGPLDADVARRLPLWR